MSRQEGERVTAKPLSPELSPQEIEALQRTLENPSMRRRLEKTQAAVLNILESDREVGKHRSSLRKREEIKSIKSVVEKIQDHRRDGETEYDLTCVKDLVGAQMICAYTDDVDAIIDWLYRPGGGRRYFRIVNGKRDIERQREKREHRTGYRAYHVCLKLRDDVAKARSLPDGSENVKFELQVKTAIDASWDFKTHDITYKAVATDPSLQHHMKLISDSLGSIDKQTLLLRNRMVGEQTMRREVREAACRLIFYVTLKPEQKASLRIGDKCIEQRQESDIEELERVLEEYLRSHGIDNTYTIGLALVALCRDSPLKQEQALSCASHLVRQAEKQDNEEEYYGLLGVRALLRWAFHKTRHAVDDMRYVMQLTNERKDMNDYVYYVSELYEPTAEDVQLAKECVKKLQSSDDHRHIDTVGAYYIRFGEDIEQLRYGLGLARKAKELAQGSDLEPVLNAFCSYHEYDFHRQLSKHKTTL